MRFQSIVISEALGWSLAHSVRAGETRLGKGLVLEEDHLALLETHGITTVHAFKIDPDDVPEDDAALALAEHICGSGLKVGHATKGRCNLHAEADGLLLVDPALDDLNGVDEAITVATLPAHAPVRAGQLVATAKIIPYAVSNGQLAAALNIKTRLSLAAFQPFIAHLLVTGAELPAKTRALTERRLARVGGTIDQYSGCDHRVQSVSDALSGLANKPGDMILLLGLSAISDRRDILPAGLEAAGGTVIQLGMPVDPGNLLMLGSLNGKTVLGLPGCARSPALNGLDWVLDRFAAQLPLDAMTLRRMGIGGLLKETASRPEPRAPEEAAHPLTQAIILAAGRSSRSGKTHKLLAKLNGKPVISHTVAMLCAATPCPPILVTGHAAEQVARAAAGYPATAIFNPAFAGGMASSLRLALEHIGDDIAHVLVCLGDMPFVQPETIKALRESARRLGEARIFIPTFNGKRGHPVLWRRDMIPELMRIDGDKGGRDIIHNNEALVVEVPVNDPGVLIDLDTPEALARFGMDT